MEWQDTLCGKILSECDFDLFVSKLFSVGSTFRTCQTVTLQESCPFCELETRSFLGTLPGRTTGKEDPAKDMLWYLNRDLTLASPDMDRVDIRRDDTIAIENNAFIANIFNMQNPELVLNRVFVNVWTRGIRRRPTVPWSPGTDYLKIFFKIDRCQVGRFENWYKTCIVLCTFIVHKHN